MLIVKTERLEQKRASTPPDELGEASRNLAVEQRMIRSELVFMLGGEIEDEEVEAEQSTELQEGRLANRGQRDLRAATVAMSQAEKWLTGANTAEALKAERAAVVALQRAFTRDRYILRALATRSQLDLSRRLTGTVAEPIGWRRIVESRPADRRAAYLQSLLQGLGELSVSSSADPADRHLSARIGVLAELAVRTDAESRTLRTVAADLQKLADSWSASSSEARARAIDAVAAQVAAEARRALADPDDRRARASHGGDRDRGARVRRSARDAVGSHAAANRRARRRRSIDGLARAHRRRVASIGGGARPAGVARSPRQRFRSRRRG
jgi:hypothetical protein